MSTDIPFGYCHCGCGKKTTLAPQTQTSKGWIKGEPIKYKVGHNNRGFAWRFSGGGKGGRIINEFGYVCIYMPDYPRADKKGYVLEHIYVAETTFNITIPPGSIVHHRNEIRTDNAPDNLLVCTIKKHAEIHQKLRALKACGNETWRKCEICKKWDNPVNLTILKHHCYHNACCNEYEKNRRAKKFK